MIKFTIFGKPPVLQRHRDSKHGGKYDPSRAVKEAFLAQAHEYRPEKPLKGPVQLIVTAYFGANPRTEVEIHELPEENYHVKTPDGSNVLKLVEDALNRKFWTDDKCISDSRVIKRKER